MSKTIGAVVGLVVGGAGGFALWRMAQVAYNDCYEGDACIAPPSIPGQLPIKSLMQQKECLKSEAKRCQDLHPVVYRMSGYGTAPFSEMPIAISALVGAMLGGYISS